LALGQFQNGQNEAKMGVQLYQVTGQEVTIGGGQSLPVLISDIGILTCKRCAFYGKK
jgi:hypothetical protein